MKRTEYSQPSVDPAQTTRSRVLRTCGSGFMVLGARADRMRSEGQFTKFAWNSNQKKLHCGSGSGWCMYSCIYVWEQLYVQCAAHAKVFTVRGFVLMNIRTVTESDTLTSTDISRRVECINRCCYLST